MYDTVVVRTVQDALIALLFNHNIQAVVVRFGVPYPSVNHNPDLARNGASSHPRHRCLDPGGYRPREHGPYLGRICTLVPPGATGT